jgi:hypothetical protein
MSTQPETTRWWEYYLPRYLMPSIAGAAIVNWLCAYGGDGLRSLLLLPIGGKSLDASSLTLLFLYGNLFCYVASYPVLVFHATRVMDFSAGRWKPRVLDGYLVTMGLVTAVFFLRLISPQCRYWVAFVGTLIISGIQLARLRAVLSNRFTVPGHGDAVNSAYFYSYVLAYRRGIPAVEEVTDTSRDLIAQTANLSTDDEEEKEEVRTRRSHTNLWRREFMDTYRHLREHGNSAFIFLLELALAALVFCVITKPEQTPEHQLGAIGFLFAIWSVPSVFVHLLAQHLERRFSRYDQKLPTASAPST